MTGTTKGGAVGTQAFIIDCPMKAATYTAGQVVLWNSTNANWETATTLVRGARVVAENIVCAANDLAPLIAQGPARVKFDDVCENGELIVPSNAAAGNAEKYVAPACATPNAAEIAALAKLQSEIFGRTMEEVLGTVKFYLVWVF